MTGAGDSDCPACGASAGNDRWCGVCGLDLHGVEARDIRHLVTVLAATNVQLNTIRARRDALDAQLAERKLAARRHIDVNPPVAPFAPTAPPRAMPDWAVPRASGSEWGVDRIRNLLLWTGAALLALSALAFTAVAWTHLGPVGRAGLLLAITVVSAVLAARVRHRLPATSGALTGLTIALALVDWQVARRAGAAPSMSTAAWWAIGAAVVAALAAGLARVASPVPAHRAIALLLPGSAVLAVAALADAAWSGALGFAVIAAVLTESDLLVGSRLTDPVVRTTLRLAAGLTWTVGATLAIIAAFAPHTFAQTLAPAAVMLGLAVAPGLASTRRPVTTVTRWAASFVVLSLVGAALTLASTSIGPIGLLTLAAVLGSIAVALAPSLGELWRGAALDAGIAAAAAGFFFAVVEAAVAMIGPLAWLANAWNGDTGARAIDVVAGPHTQANGATGWCAVVTLAAVALAIMIASVPRRGAPPAPARLLGAVGIGLAAIVLAPVAGGATALVACIVATAVTALALLGSAIAARRFPDRALAVALLAVVPALPATGWAALTPATSISVLAVTAVSALVAAIIGRTASLRAVHAGVGAATTIALASVATLASGGSRPVAGFVGAVVAGVVLVIGTFARRETFDGLAVEIVSSAGIVGAVLLTVPSPAWIAGALTAMVPLLLLASARRDRRAVYGSAAAGAALGATWAWLAAAGVTVVEAYTLPAAALALGAGTFVAKDGRGRSWLSLGPAIVLALAPTIALAIVRHDDLRAIAAGVAAVALLLVGARWQLQAPLVLGAIALLVLGIDKIGPQAVRLPRWTMLAIAGGLLLWVGTTFERRRDDMSRAARRLGELG